MPLKNKMRLYRILTVLCWIIWAAIFLPLFIISSITAGIMGGIVVVFLAFFCTFPIWDLKNKIDKFKTQQEQGKALYILSDK